MFKVKQKTAPDIFNNQFSKIQHKYPTRYSKNNFNIPKKISKLTSYSTVHRGPNLWNAFLDEKTKNLTSLNQFKTAIKFKILNQTNELDYF